MALWMLAAYLLNNLFQAIAAWVMSSISQRALKHMRRDLFQHLQTLPQSFFDRHPAGELMSRLTNDIDAINQAVSQNVTSLVASVLSMIRDSDCHVLSSIGGWRWLRYSSSPSCLVYEFVARYTRRGFRDLQRHRENSTG